MPSIDLVPIGFFFVFAIGLAAVCVECGFRWGSRRSRAGAHEAESAVGAIVAATLALLAFLLGFTFNIAANRFEERRSAVL